MEKLCPELLFDGSGTLLRDKVLIHDRGIVLDVGDRFDFDDNELHFYKGIVCPGFINSHCHLELSHMKGMADSGTGLLSFLKKVVGFRDIEQEFITDAISRADGEMYENGIVAVGDISNKLDTAECKRNSHIAYHTFVEMFDFMQESMTQKTIEQYYPVFEGQANDGLNKISIVPHAPYTVSEKLFQYINDRNRKIENITVSIHNQETVHEDRLFLDKKGDFPDFYASFGFDLRSFEVSGHNAIHYAMNNMDSEQRTLFVHNTLTSAEDVKSAIKWNKNVYWATCPNANLYIENRLPEYQNFRESGAKMTIGTDSLTSNWQLSILEEMKTILKYNSYISVAEVLTWATSNGAEALGYEDHFGFFRKGMKPGILLIDCDVAGERVNLSKASVVRLT